MNVGTNGSDYITSSEASTTRPHSEWFQETPNH
jgi:hypothetical protein